MAAARATTPWFIKHVMNPILTITGAFPLLSVKGRRSGKVYTTPVNLLEVEGARYVLSPRGETGWSRNLRTLGECSLKVRGNQRRYRATELAPEQRPPLIAAYLERWGNQTRGQFEKLPDPADHPVFRLEPL